MVWDLNWDGKKKQFHETIFFCLSNSGPQVGLGPSQLPQSEGHPGQLPSQLQRQTIYTHSQAHS